MTTISPAVGVVILSVAAAAVIWCVKPEQVKEGVLLGWNWNMEHSFFHRFHLPLLLPLPQTDSNYIQHSFIITTPLVTPPL